MANIWWRTDPTDRLGGGSNRGWGSSGFFPFLGRAIGDGLAAVTDDFFDTAAAPVAAPVVQGFFDDGAQEFIEEIEEWAAHVIPEVTAPPVEVFVPVMMAEEFEDLENEIDSIVTAIFPEIVAWVAAVLPDDYLMDESDSDLVAIAVFGAGMGDYQFNPLFICNVGKMMVR